MLDVEMINTARHALRAAMKAGGHTPERMATERFGQGLDTVSLWCPVCGASGVAVKDDDDETITLKGAAVKRCAKEA